MVFALNLLCILQTRCLLQMGSSVGKHRSKRSHSFNNRLTSGLNGKPHATGSVTSRSAGLVDRDAVLDHQDCDPTTTADNTNNAHNRYTADGECKVESAFSRPLVSCADLCILDLKFGVDKKNTFLDEKSSSVLKYRTPHFRYSAVNHDTSDDDQ